MDTIFRVLLAISSTSTMAIVYFINNNYKFHFMMNCSKYMSIFLVGTLPIILTCCAILMTNKLQIENMPQVATIEEVSGNFLPSYLGYFFVGLSLSQDDVFWLIFAIVTLFVYLSQVNHFNPILLLFGYYFYAITTSLGKHITVISKVELTTPEEVKDLTVRRINSYVFININ